MYLQWYCPCKETVFTSVFRVAESLEVGKEQVRVLDVVCKIALSSNGSVSVGTNAAD